MGDSEITSPATTPTAPAGRCPASTRCPLTGQYTTYSLYKDGAEKGKPDYVPDSAATGSAWATGTKTYDNAISVDIDGHPAADPARDRQGQRPEDRQRLDRRDPGRDPRRAGRARRGAQLLRPRHRQQCGDDALDQGGLGSISEQLLDTRADLTLGGGAASFAQTAKAGQWNGQTLFDQADRPRLPGGRRDAAGPRRRDRRRPDDARARPFTAGNFPTRYAPTTATVGGADLAPQTCQPNPARLVDRPLARAR